jgi:CheY-like chemotaxis protein
VSATVLIVDDHEDTRELYALALGAEMGVNVVTAEDGVRALAMLHEHRPAVVVVDLGMPIMDGYELVRRMRQDPVTARTQTIALSGFTGTQDRAKARSAGFDHFLGKPCLPQELAAIVKSCLEKS